MDNKIIYYGDIHFPQSVSKFNNFQTIIYHSLLYHIKLFRRFVISTLSDTFKLLPYHIKRFFDSFITTTMIVSQSLFLLMIILTWFDLSSFSSFILKTEELSSDENAGMSPRRHISRYMRPNANSMSRLYFL